MNTKFDFRRLFVLDLANNHQGNLEHGLRIIREFGQVAAANNARTALKFQFRHIDTFIHPAHRQNSDNPHIPRFLSTALGKQEYAVMAEAVRRANLITMATPFDEESVQWIEDLDVEVIKVASCSANDWPLLEKIAQFNRPVIVSTGGLTLEAIDDIVSFFDHRRVHFALMHCVSIYPTPLEHLQLNQIEVIRRRHPGKVVGFSTHEPPDQYGAVQVAVAKGAEIHERHVGLLADKIKLNAYSSQPDQIDRWLKAAQASWAMCGAPLRLPPEKVESDSLAALQRGVFARRPIKSGEKLGREDVYFAMPLAPGGLNSGRWKNGMIATVDIGKDAAVLPGENSQAPPPSPQTVLLHAVHTIKAMLNEASIALPTDFKLEFSHHYGIDNFPMVGAVLIDCINREYCKKLIVQMPGQHHPSHYHKRKEETFQVLSGIMEAEVEGRRRTLFPGDILVIPQGVWHSFWTEKGLVFEEVSTTHFKDDSFYEDKRINDLKPHERKTTVSQWGRYQFD